MQQSVSWTEPRLCHYQYDMSKAWFVHFEFTDETGKVHRKQYRNGINTHHKKSERIRQGNASCIYFKQKLEDGWNPVTNEEQPGEKRLTIRSAFERVMELKESSIKKKSLDKYNEIGKMFLTWAAERKFDMLPPSRLDGRMAQAHLDYLVTARKYGGKTHNNHLSILHAICAMMTARGREWIKENPFTGIAKLPEDVGKNIAFTEDEVKALLHFLRYRDLRLCYAASFMLHAFIRMTETCELRARQIDRHNKTIRIESSSAKNRKQESVAIPEDLWLIIEEMNLQEAPGEWFIFGRCLETGPAQLTRPHDLSDKFREYREHLRQIITAIDAGETVHKNYDRKAQEYFFEFEENARLIAKVSDDKTYYSFKHTGVVLYWPVIKDVYLMMRQLRHHDMKTTMIYLKSLGLMPNEAFLNAKLKLS